MSKMVEERIFYEEDTKCPPQSVHWSNPNEVRASHELDERISGARSRDYPYEPRMRLEEDDNRAKRHKHKHHHKHNASATESSSPKNEHRNIDKAIAMEEGLFFEENKKITEAYSPHGQHAPRPIPNEYRASREGIKTAHDTSCGRHRESLVNGPDTSPGAEPLENVSRARHPNAIRSTVERIFPGAIREGGSNNEVGYDEDDLTLESRTDMIPPTVAAELVNIEEEERLVQDQINEALERERQLVQDQINEALENERQKAVVAEVVSSRGRRWKLAGAILLLLTGIAVALGITLRPDLAATPSPTPVPTPSPTPVPTLSQEDLGDLLSSVSSDRGKALQTPATHQNMAFEWLANDANYTNETLIQRYALATLYLSTSGDSWNINDLWLSRRDMCEWNQVVCANDSVTDISFLANNLSGTLPPEIGLLSDSLETFFLGYNKLELTIPTEVGQLKHLDSLFLDNNTLTGTIPTEINSLRNLTWLSLYGNMLTGSYDCPTSIYLCMISCDILSGVDRSNVTADQQDALMGIMLDNAFESISNLTCRSL